MKKVIIGLALCASSFVWAADGDYRIFKNSDGQEIKARILEYNASASKVHLELKNGKKGWMPLSSISSEDQAYVSAWSERSRFLSDEMLGIEVTEEDSGWQHDGDSQRDRKVRQTQYFVSLSNRGDADLNNIRISYCLYREKIGGMGVDHYDLGIMKVLAGESVTEKGRSRHGSFKVSSEGFINNVVGARFRLHWKAPDGSELIREVCLPENLSEKNHPWKIPEFSEKALATHPKPEVDLTSKNLAKDDVKALAKQYAEVWENHDYAGWRALVEPLHYGNSDLSEGIFNRYEVNDVNIKKVDGHNVYVQMTYKGGHKQLGWLQFHPSGTLKYTPLLFKHPVAGALSSFHLLYNNDRSWNGGAVRNLSEAGIPMFGYDPSSSTSDRQDSIEKIFEWIEENGASHDMGDPRLMIPADQFGELLKKAESRVKSGSFYG